MTSCDRCSNLSRRKTVYHVDDCPQAPLIEGLSSYVMDMNFQPYEDLKYALADVVRRQKALERAEEHLMSMAVAYVSEKGNNNDVAQPQVGGSKYVALLQENGAMRVNQVSQALHGSTDPKAVKRTRATLSYLKKKGAVNNEERGIWDVVARVLDFHERGYRPLAGDEGTG